MPSLYNCRHSGDQYRITKFDSSLNVESSYLCTTTECDCPAGHRHTCRHREMLPKFLSRNADGTDWFYDFDRGGWVQGMMNAEGIVDPVEKDEYLASIMDKVDPLRPQGDRLRANLSDPPDGWVGLDDPAELHNSIAEAIGEPESYLHEPANSLEAPLHRPAPQIKRRV